MQGRSENLVSPPLLDPQAAPADTLRMIPHSAPPLSVSADATGSGAQAATMGNVEWRRKGARPEPSPLQPCARPTVVPPTRPSKPAAEAAGPSPAPAAASVEEEEELSVASPRPQL